MANTPEGTPYVESSDLVANYPAASLALANRVDLVGVLPFADAAARTTAISSPTDGQYSYLQDTNATEFWNGSAWVAAGVAPGFVHINTTTFNVVSSVSLNSVFTNDYENYRIVAVAGDSAGSDVQLRWRASGSDNSTANSYVTTRFRAIDTSLSGVRTTSNVAQVGVIRSVLAGFVFDVYRPFVAAETSFTVMTQDQVSTASDLYIFSGGHTQTVAYDGFTIFPSSGNFSGKIRVYGYKNS